MMEELELRHWNKFLKQEMTKQYMINLKAFIKERREQCKVYPDPKLTFNALHACPYESLKVIILGDEPDANSELNNGIAFSTLSTTPSPKLKALTTAIFKDYFNENVGGVNVRQTNDLTQWAEQGVLLLNQILTVEEGKPKSHKDKGWEEFTENVIKECNMNRSPLVFIFWGTEARKYAKLINRDKHKVIESDGPHKGNPFTETNTFIKKAYLGAKTPINWALLKNYNKVSI